MPPRSASPPASSSSSTGTAATAPASPSTSASRSTSFPRRLPTGAPFEVIPLLRNRFWQEVALWFPAERTLVSADAVGTAQYYRGPQERLAVSPVLRLLPPRKLLRVEPEHILVGHGEGIHDDAAAALRDAVTRARSRTPAWLWSGLRAHGPFGSHRRAR